jgi:hypothetical protein
MNPDPDLEGPKTRGSGFGSGSATLVLISTIANTGILKLKLSSGKLTLRYFYDIYDYILISVLDPDSMSQRIRIQAGQSCLPKKVK